MKLKSVVLLSYIIIFFFGLIIGLQFKNKKSLPLVNITRSSQKDLTNPILDCELSNFEETKILPVKDKVEKYIDSQKNNFKEISVYFRDLNNGPWFGINEKTQFAPASLLKVPVMIAYLKLAESDPSILTSIIKYENKTQSQENLPTRDQLILDRGYTIDLLLSRMISMSDNTAFDLLVSKINPKQLKNIHQEIGITYPNQSTPDDYISVKSYAGLFRVLYNSTYLSRQMSEKALNYLLKSDFVLGIKAGLPKDIKTALKFGIKDDPHYADIVQIHDCGIVYAKKSPYILCVMTKGQSRDKLITIIKEISSIIYHQTAD